MFVYHPNSFFGESEFKIGRFNQTHKLIMRCFTNYKAESFHQNVAKLAREPNICQHALPF